MEWEYLIARFENAVCINVFLKGSNSDVYNAEVKGKIVTDVLDKLGSFGWEMVTTVVANFSQIEAQIFYFKRPR
jgi:hypothetical protein